MDNQCTCILNISLSAVFYFCLSLVFSLFFLFSFPCKVNVVPLLVYWPFLLAVLWLERVGGKRNYLGVDGLRDIFCPKPAPPKKKKERKELSIFSLFT